MLLLSTGRLKGKFIHVFLFPALIENLDFGCGWTLVTLQIRRDRPIVMLPMRSVRLRTPFMSTIETFVLGSP